MKFDAADLKQIKEKITLQSRNLSRGAHVVSLLGALLGTDERNDNFDLPTLLHPPPDSIPNHLFAFLLRKKAVDGKNDKWTTTIDRHAIK